MGAITYATGTPLVWKNAGGDYVITLASLGAAAARQGAKGDLGATRAVRWSCRVTLNMDVAPVNGTAVEIWWSSSSSAVAGTDNTGAASGADAAYTGSAGGGVATTKLQLQLVGVMPMTADADLVIQVAEFTFYPLSRYGMPIVVNLTAQILEGDNDSHALAFTPLGESVA